MAILVKKTLYAPAPDAKTNEMRSPRYLNAKGPVRIEHRSLARESDWSNENYERVSEDNGRTWGDWTDVHAKGYELIGEDEITFGTGTEEWNDTHQHFVSGGYQRIFLQGHKKAYQTYWSEGKDGFIDHANLHIRQDGEEQTRIRWIKYEKGPDYDPNDHRNKDFLKHNRSICTSRPDILKNGDIVLAVEASIRACCRIAGLNLSDICPSAPDIMNGLIIAYGRYDPNSRHYALTYSRPIVISDLKSSRCVNEPIVSVLPSGRIIAVFRGSNVISKNWRTRIEPGTPCHKWFCYSDDNGKTFTDPVPWHFDDREVFYSAATWSVFVKSAKNGSVYWIGNISGHETYGNYPRHPLVIAQVDDRGLLKKDTLTVIDKKQDHESDLVQLSNFSILQDRETQNIEVYLTRHGERDENPWQGDCYRYDIDVEG